jgi:HEAT repeat protein
MGSVALEQLVVQALVVARGVKTPDDYDAIWSLLWSAREFGDDAVAAGVQLTSSADPVERSVGCDLLGALSEVDDTGTVRETAATTLIALAATESDVDVCWSIARALGSTNDARAVPVLVRLSDNDDKDVRFQVACALPFCTHDSAGEVSVPVMTALMGDDDEDVRDWATFGLGTQMEVDGEDVRDALLARVDDPNPDVADEALVGLARRRDKRAFALVDDRLRRDTVGRLAVEAAEYLCAPQLLPALRALAEWWDSDAELLNRAIRRCDPQEQGRQLAAAQEFLAAVDEMVVGSAMPRRVSLFCDCLDHGISVGLSDREGFGCRDFDALMELAGGDPRAAARVALET